MLRSMFTSWSSRAHVLSSCRTWVQLPCGMWDLSPPLRDRTQVPCIGRRILTHWTTREVPPLFWSLLPQFSLLLHFCCYSYSFLSEPVMLRLLCLQGLLTNRLNLFGAKHECLTCTGESIGWKGIFLDYQSSIFKSHGEAKKKIKHHINWWRVIMCA